LNIITDDFTLSLWELMFFSETNGDLLLLIIDPLNTGSLGICCLSSISYCLVYVSNTYEVTGLFILALCYYNALRLGVKLLDINIFL